MEYERKILSLESRIRELEDRLDNAERSNREAMDEIDRVRSRVSDLEYRR